MCANNHSPKGPSIPDSRYITEHVPQGLCLLESLGKILGVEMKTTTALIDIASALLKRDFRSEGRTIDKLGIEMVQRIISDLRNYTVSNLPIFEHKSTKSMSVTVALKSGLH